MSAVTPVPADGRAFDSPDDWRERLVIPSVPFDPETVDLPGVPERMLMGAVAVPWSVTRIPAWLFSLKVTVLPAWALGLVAVVLARTGAAKAGYGVLVATAAGLALVGALGVMATAVRLLERGRHARVETPAEDTEDASQ